MTQQLLEPLLVETPPSNLQQQPGAATPEDFNKEEEDEELEELTSEEGSIVDAQTADEAARRAAELFNLSQSNDEWYSETNGTSTTTTSRVTAIYNLYSRFSAEIQVKAPSLLEENSGNDSSATASAVKLGWDYFETTLHNYGPLLIAVMAVFFLNDIRVPMAFPAAQTSGLLLGQACYTLAGGLIPHLAAGGDKRGLEAVAVSQRPFLSWPLLARSLCFQFWLCLFFYLLGFWQGVRLAGILEIYFQFIPSEVWHISKGCFYLAAYALPFHCIYSSLSRFLCYHGAQHEVILKLLRWVSLICLPIIFFSADYYGAHGAAMALLFWAMLRAITFALHVAIRRFKYAWQAGVRVRLYERTRPKSSAAPLRRRFRAGTGCIPQGNSPSLYQRSNSPRSFTPRSGSSNNQRSSPRSANSISYRTNNQLYRSNPSLSLDDAVALSLQREAERAKVREAERAKVREADLELKNSGDSPPLNDQAAFAEARRLKLQSINLIKHIGNLEEDVSQQQSNQQSQQDLVSVSNSSPRIGPGCSPGRFAAQAAGDSPADSATVPIESENNSRTAEFTNTQQRPPGGSPSRKNEKRNSRRCKTMVSVRSVNVDNRIILKAMCLPTTLSLQQYLFKDVPTGLKALSGFAYEALPAAILRCVTEWCIAGLIILGAAAKPVEAPMTATQQPLAVLGIISMMIGFLLIAVHGAITHLFSAVIVLKASGNVLPAQRLTQGSITATLILGVIVSGFLIVASFISLVLEAPHLSLALAACVPLELAGLVLAILCASVRATRRKAAGIITVTKLGIITIAALTVLIIKQIGDISGLILAGFAIALGDLLLLGWEMMNNSQPPVNVRSQMECDNFIWALLSSSPRDENNNVIPLGLIP